MRVLSPILAGGAVVALAAVGGYATFWVLRAGGSVTGAVVLAVYATTIPLLIAAADDISKRKGNREADSRWLWRAFMLATWVLGLLVWAWLRGCARWGIRRTAPLDAAFAAALTLTAVAATTVALAVSTRAPAQPVQVAPAEQAPTPSAAPQGR